MANKIAFAVVNADMIKSGEVNLNSFNVFYIRTGAEPTTYNDPEVIAKIKTRIQSGAKLIMEYNGLYLGQYLGVGSVSQSSWMPVFTDGAYYVKPMSSSVLLRNLPVWDPPAPPDRETQLVARLKSPGIYTILKFAFDGQQTTVAFCRLASIPNGLGQDRNVYQGGEQATINYINFGKGKIFHLDIGFFNSVPASQLIVGPIGHAIRENAVKAATVVNGSDPTVPSRGG
jgi:hypothetical protein